MRFRSALAAVFAVLFFAPLGAGAADTTPLKIPAILSLTGNGAFVGKQDQQSMQLVQKLVNAKGGVNGHPVEFEFFDDASNPQTGVQLANQIIASKAPIFFGASLTQQCAAVVPLVRENGPADFCLSPGLQPAPNGWVWSSSVSLKDYAVALMRYFRGRGITRLGILSSTDSTGQEIDRDYDYAKSLPENKEMQFVAREHFNLADVSVNAQVSRIKAANPQVILTWTIGPAFGTELRAIADVGYTGPVLGANGDLVKVQLDQYKAFLPKELLFTGVLASGRDSVGNGPIKAAQDVYFAAYKSIGVTQPDFPTTLAWDPALLVIDAYKHLGLGATPQQFKDYLNTLHGWAGINGIYDFRDGSQHGVGLNGIVMVRYDGESGEVKVVSKRGGYVK